MSRHGAALNPLHWLVLPSMAAVLATVLLATPFRIVTVGLPEPLFPVVLAFSWAVIRPSVLGPILLFVIGLFLDLFWGGRLGLWAFSLICAYGLALGGRSLMAGQGMFVMGGWYAATCGICFGVAYFFATVMVHGQPNLLAVLWQLAWTVALYPAAYWLVDQFEDADVRYR